MLKKYVNNICNAIINKAKRCTCGGISMKCIPKYIMYNKSYNLKGVLREGWIEGMKWQTPSIRF
jgi:hypothetical protein